MCWYQPSHQTSVNRPSQMHKPNPYGTSPNIQTNLFLPNTHHELAYEHQHPRPHAASRPPPRCPLLPGPSGSSGRKPPRAQEPSRETGGRVSSPTSQHQRLGDEGRAASAGGELPTPLLFGKKYIADQSCGIARRSRKPGSSAIWDTLHRRTRA